MAMGDNILETKYSLIEKIKGAESDLKLMENKKNYYKEKLKRLEEKIKNAEEVIEFYALENNWEKANLSRVKPSYFCAHINDDEEKINTGIYLGGKRARAYLKKYSQKENL